jgi:hypothetical protein
MTKCSVAGARQAASNRTSGRYPLDPLAGDGGDAVEVLIVVENAKMRSLGDGGNQQVGESHRPMLAMPSKDFHDFDRAIKIALLHRNSGKGLIPQCASPHEICMTAGAEQHFQIDDTARSDIASEDEGTQDRIHRGMGHPRERALVGKICRC